VAQGFVDSWCCELLVALCGPTPSTRHPPPRPPTTLSARQPASLVALPPVRPSASALHINRYGTAVPSPVTNMVQRSAGPRTTPDGVQKH
jgi:hypothetical protein